MNAIENKIEFNEITEAEVKVNRDLDIDLSSLTDEELEKLIGQAKGTNTALNKERVSRLPVATDEQVKIVCAAVVAGQPTPEGCRKNEDFRFNEAQAKALKKARDHREAIVSDPAFKAKVIEEMQNKDVVLKKHVVKITKSGAVKTDMSTEISAESIHLRMKAEIEALKAENAALKAV